MSVSSPETKTSSVAGPPSARSAAFYLDWIGELKQLHEAGMLDDEDFAYQRAERLHQLLNTPRRGWLGWIRVGVPLSLLAGGAGWWFSQDWMVAEAAGGIFLLCVLAALARYHRERRFHLTPKERTQILYDLLAEDLITSEEFLAYDECLTGRTER